MNFVRKPIFRVENCPQVRIFPKHIKVPLIAIFLNTLDNSNKNGIILDSNALIKYTAKGLLFIQNCQQMCQKLSASNACMLATFSVSASFVFNAFWCSFSSCFFFFFLYFEGHYFPFTSVSFCKYLCDKSLQSYEIGNLNNHMSLILKFHKSLSFVAKEY